MTAFENKDLKQLIPVATRAATVEGSAVDIDEYEGNLAVVLDSGAASAGDTMDLTIEERADATDTWAAVPADALYNPATGANATFTQVTAAGGASFQVRGLRKNRLKAQIRAVGTIAGNGGESITFGVYLVATNKYANWS